MKLLQTWHVKDILKRNPNRLYMVSIDNIPFFAKVFKNGAVSTRKGGASYRTTTV